MRVLIVGEGPHEQGALPTLVCRLQSRVTETAFDFVRNGRRVHGKGRGIFKKAVGWMLEAESRFDALVFLTDEDGDRSRRGQMDKAQEWTGAGKLASEIDLDALTQRCRNGFAPFAERVSGLA